jgi:hypothetical protein
LFNFLINQINLALQFNNFFPVLLADVFHYFKFLCN